MGKWFRRILLGTVAVVGLGGLWKLQQLAKHLVVEGRVVLAAWGIWGARIVANPIVKNPTNKEVEITYPFVVVDLGDHKDIASSNPNGIKLKIPANGSLDWNQPDPALYPNGLPPIELRIESGSLVEMIGRLLLAPFTGVEVPKSERTLIIKTQTRILTVAGEVPVPIPDETLLIG